MKMGQGTSDSDLMLQIRAGDMDAFRALVEKYEGAVATTIIGMLGPCMEADDIGQEVFIRFYKAINTFRGDSSIKTYLTRIAINLSLNELKARKRRNIFNFFGKEEKEIAYPDYAWSPDAMENAALVQQALQRLQPNARAVIVLRMLEGYSTKETAKMLNLPMGTVLSRLARAQDKLRNILIELDQ